MMRLNYFFAYVFDAQAQQLNLCGTAPIFIKVFIRLIVAHYMQLCGYLCALHLCASCQLFLR